MYKDSVVLGRVKLLTKQAIGSRLTFDEGYDDVGLLESNDVDHIADEVAEEAENMFRMAEREKANLVLAKIQARRKEAKRFQDYFKDNSEEENEAYWEGMAEGLSNAYFYITRILQGLPLLAED